VSILGFFIEFGIEEGVDVINVEPESAKRRAGDFGSSWTWTPGRQYERTPNGTLALEIKTGTRSRAR
jgi:hypothetical protein